MEISQLKNLPLLESPLSVKASISGRGREKREHGMMFVSLTSAIYTAVLYQVDGVLETVDAVDCGIEWLWWVEISKQI